MVEFDHYRPAHEVFAATQNKLTEGASALLALGQALGAVITGDTKPIALYEAVRIGVLSRMKVGQRVDRATIASYRQMMEEYRWLRLHQPRYRIYPNMVAALARISIEIDAKHLKLPFPTLTIDMPKDFFREREDTPYLKGMMVHCRWKDDPEPDKFNYGVNYTSTDDGTSYVAAGPPPANSYSNVMIVDLDFGDETYVSQITEETETHGCKPFAIFDLTEGKTISQCFDDMPEAKNFIGGYMPSSEFQKTCLRIAVGAVFLAVNNNEFVERFLPQGFAERLDRVKSSNNKKLLTKTQSQIQGSGLSRTFNVGREIVIPQQHESNEASGSGEPTGRELSFAHVRSGHMAWQPYGARDNPQYKLIFRPFTVVRGDLPFAPTPPRAIK